MRVFLRFVVGLSLAALVSGCTSSSNFVRGTHLAEITLTPSQHVIALGQEASYTTEAIWSNGDTQELSTRATWSSSDTKVATIFSLEGRSRVLAVGPGTAIITVAIGEIEQTATLVVTPSPIKTLKINAPRTLEVGKSQSFTVTGKMANNTVYDLTSGVSWHSSNQTIASVDDAGFVAALAPGIVTISAVSGEIQSLVQLTIPTPTLTAIEILPAFSSVAAGLVRQFVAKGLFSNDTTQIVTSLVTWTSSNSSVIAIDAEGLATAVAKGVKIPQPVMIRASSGKVSQTAALTVTAPTVVKTKLIPEISSVAAGRSQQFTSEQILSDGVTRPLIAGVSWSSSDPSLVIINKDGLAKVLAPGPVTITAHFENQIGTAMLTATPPEILEVRIVPAIPFVSAGLTQTFTAEGTFTDGKIYALKNEITWSSSDPSLVTINESGLATAVAKGLDRQRAVTLTAVSGKISGTAKMTVTPPEWVKIEVTPAIPFVAAGRTVQFSAQGVLTDETVRALPAGMKWSSSDPASVTISENGLVTVIAKGVEKPRAITITALFGKVIGLAKLTVTPAELASLHVAPSLPFTPAGKSVQFIAEGTFSDGTIRSPFDVAWSSSDTTAATIDSKTGFAATLSPKAVMITASVGTIKNAIKLTITDPELTAIQISPALPAVMIGKTLSFAAEGIYTDGVTRVPANITWGSSDATAATIDGKTGLTTPLSPKVVTITAGSGAIKSSILLTVVAPLLTAIRITPDATAPIVLGREVQFAAEGKFSDNTTRNLTAGLAWSSSNPSVVAVTEGSGAAIAVSVGEAAVTAISGNIRSTVQIAVMEPKLTAIHIRSNRVTLAAGEALQFTAAGSFTDETTRPLESDIIWSSSDLALAVVDRDGLVTAVAKGLEKPRMVTVTAASVPSATGQVIVSAVNISVTPPVMTEIKMMPDQASIEVGGAQSFGAIGLLTDGTTKELTSDITWSSSDPALVVVNGNGLINVVAKEVEKPKSVTITAVSGKIIGMAKITVLPPHLTTIRIIPGEATVVAGRSQSFIVDGLFSDGTSKPLPSPIAWSLSDSAIATINTKTGLIDTLSAGVVTVAVVSEKVRGTVRLTVLPPELTDVRVSPVRPTVVSGKMQQFIALGLYTDQKERPLQSGVIWSSSDTSVATIDGNGLVSSAERGVETPLTVRITALFEKRSGTTPLTVTPQN
jgi:uncharacterized protein YjdB